jgi:3-dehydroquinate dehydratase-2
MTDVLILNGPNLNMLGVREPHLYGPATLADVEALCRNKAGALGLTIDFRQSNHEGELITWIQEARGNIRGLIINAAAYTHTSVAILDALKLLESVPIIEVHLTDPKTREEFRHLSYIELVADHTIAGDGPNGYVLALEHLSEVMPSPEA